MKLSKIRQDYLLGKLEDNHVEPDPIKMFEFWFDDVIKSEISYANAMTLSTADKEGNPSSRIVLLKHYDEKGFVFFTNYKGRKGLELRQRPQASLLFFWKELERQVRIEGSIEKTNASESDSYFDERSLESRISAIISPQSEKISDRDFLEKAWKKVSENTSNQKIQRPENWGGYRLHPQRIEFWQGRANRLHDRLLYERNESKWEISRLAP